MADLSIPAYIMNLDDPGDLSAPKGSRPWARAIRYRLGRLAREGTTKVRDFQSYLTLFEDTQGYRQLEDPQGQPFQSLGAFASARIPYGLGYDPEIILHLQHETRDMLLTERLRQWEATATHQGERTDFDNLSKSSQEERASHNGVGIVTQRKLDYLAGHAPALLTEVQEGQMSIHRAYQQARGIAQETPLTTLHRVWRQVAPGDRLRFLVEMLTPNERRALQLGYEDLEEAPDTTSALRGGGGVSTPRRKN
jgi:hypothetical protein